MTRDWWAAREVLLSTEHTRPREARNEHRRDKKRGRRGALAGDRRHKNAIHHTLTLRRTCPASDACATLEAPPSGVAAVRRGLRFGGSGRSSRGLEDWACSVWNPAEEREHLLGQSFAGKKESKAADQRRSGSLHGNFFTGDRKMSQTRSARAPFFCDNAGRILATQIVMYA
jgi:hypothetical protein